MGGVAKEVLRGWMVGDWRVRYIGGFDILERLLAPCIRAHYVIGEVVKGTTEFSNTY